MPRKNNKKRTDVNGQQPGIVPLEEQDKQIAEQTVPEKPTTIKNTPSTWKAEAIQMLKNGMSIGMVAKELDPRYQVIRAVAISAGLHSSTPRGEKAPAGIKIVLTAEEAKDLAAVLADVPQLASVLSKLPTTE